MPMNKAEIVADIAKTCGLEKKKVAEVFDALEMLAIGAFTTEGETVFLLPHFGRLTVKDRKAWTGRNPQTGAPLTVPAKRVVRFHVAKKIKDAVLER